MDVTRPTGVCFSRRWGGGCECGAPSIGVSRLGVVEIRSGVYCAESNVYLTINVLWLCVTAILVSLPSLPRRTGLFSGFCAEPEPASSIFKCHFTLDSLWSSASCQCFPWITVSFLDYVSLNLLLIGTFLAFFLVRIRLFHCSIRPSPSPTRSLFFFPFLLRFDPIKHQSTSKLSTCGRTKEVTSNNGECRWAGSGIYQAVA